METIKLFNLNFNKDFIRVFTIDFDKNVVYGIGFIVNIDLQIVPIAGSYI
ncbi:MAG: hypothetical protein IKK02_00595 [Tidjanibacter sp.]|nr:hypothetical protein [Tidjanibacter sp.]